MKKDWEIQVENLKETKMLKRKGWSQTQRGKGIQTERIPDSDMYIHCHGCRCEMVDLWIWEH
jgi:hypothetical protein